MSALMQMLERVAAEKKGAREEAVRAAVLLSMRGTPDEILEAMEKDLFPLEIWTATEKEMLAACADEKERAELKACWKRGRDALAAERMRRRKEKAGTQGTTGTGDLLFEVCKLRLAARRRPCKTVTKAGKKGGKA